MPVVIAMSIAGCDRPRAAEVVDPPSTVAARPQIAARPARVAVATINPPATAPQVHTRILETRHYRITLTDTGEEGDIEPDVTYHGLSKTSGRSITLAGTMWHTHSDIDNCPGHYLGYIFKSGKTVYAIEDQSETPSLVVTRDGKTLVDEKGVWAGENP
jgi:hypothetical protein